MNGLRKADRRHPRLLVHRFLDLMTHPSHKPELGYCARNTPAMRNNKDRRSRRKARAEGPSGNYKAGLPLTQALRLRLPAARAAPLLGPAPFMQALKDGGHNAIAITIHRVCVGWHDLDRRRLCHPLRSREVCDCEPTRYASRRAEGRDAEGAGEFHQNRAIDHHGLEFGTDSFSCGTDRCSTAQESSQKADYIYKQSLKLKPSHSKLAPGRRYRIAVGASCPLEDAQLGGRARFELCRSAPWSIRLISLATGEPRRGRLRDACAPA